MPHCSTQSPARASTFPPQSPDSTQIAWSGVELPPCAPPAALKDARQFLLAEEEASDFRGRDVLGSLTCCKGIGRCRWQSNPRRCSPSPPPKVCLRCACASLAISRVQSPLDRWHHVLPLVNVAPLLQNCLQRAHHLTHHPLTSTV